MISHDIFFFLLSRLEYDVNVIEKEGRKLAKEYEKVLSINIEDIIEQETCTTIIDHKEPSEEPSENEEEIYALLNSSVTSSNKTEENVSTSSGNSSADHSSVQDIISKDSSPMEEKNVNSTNQDGNNSDTGLSSLHTSSDEGTYEVGTLV